MSYRVLPDNENRNSQSLRVSRKFILGTCGCGCGTQIPIRSKHKTLGLFKFRHCVPRRGKDSHSWKGGKSTSIYGYTIVKKYDHHFAMKGYVFEHRLVWEQYHKASLLPWADCHHINGKKKDNRIENLQAMMHGQHTRITHTK